METTTTLVRPLRLGTFHTLAEAERGVLSLQESGFGKEEIGILCLERIKEKSFYDLPDGTLPESNPGQTIPAGGLLGAALGGLALTATSILGAGVPLLAAGTILIGGGAIAGSFTGAMSSLGYDQKTIDFCHEAVKQGKILVAVKPQQGTPESLEQAETIMAECGANPILTPVLKV